jgi:hypothetical protein
VKKLVVSLLFLGTCLAAAPASMRDALGTRYLREVTLKPLP